MIIFNINKILNNEMTFNMTYENPTYNLHMTESIDNKMESHYYILRIDPKIKSKYISEFTKIKKGNMPYEYEYMCVIIDESNATHMLVIKNDGNIHMIIGNPSKIEKNMVTDIGYFGDYRTEYVIGRHINDCKTRYCHNYTFTVIELIKGSKYKNTLCFDDNFNRTSSSFTGF